MAFTQKIENKKKPNNTVQLFLVGVAGFEPAASCSQSRRDNRATLHPEIRVQIYNFFSFIQLN